jgi:hypothetical protein
MDIYMYFILHPWYTIQLFSVTNLRYKFVAQAKFLLFYLCSEYEKSKELF